MTSVKSVTDSIPPEVEELFGLLAELASAGPIPAVREGSTAVGMTLLQALGIPHQSKRKPNYKGVVVNARRRMASREHRVNLFAKVPDWSLSDCKSSGEIVSQYGDDAEDGGKRLFCTVSARRANSHGLKLAVDAACEHLVESFIDEQGNSKEVARWSLDTLKDRLVQTHPATIWVVANSSKSPDGEMFHYRYAEYTGPPNTDVFAELLAAGTVTVDHLILKNSSGTKEKGPLFKLKPSNISMLFSDPIKVNLLRYASRQT